MSGKMMLVCPSLYPCDGPQLSFSDTAKCSSVYSYATPFPSPYCTNDTVDSEAFSLC